MVRTIAFVTCLIPLVAAAQIHSAAGRGVPKVAVPSRPKPLTPQDCEAFSHQRHPLGKEWLRSVCEDTNFTIGNLYARSYGMPRQSRTVISLPAHGSADAKAYGLECMGGLAMRRLANGWEQLRDREGNYQRCRDL